MTAPVAVATVGANGQNQPAFMSTSAVAQPYGWRPVQTLADLPPPPQKTRWRKTQTTFGPLGRVLCTIGLVVPLPLMILGGIVADPFCLGGAAVWGVIVMPWGLRDVWRAGQLSSRAN